MLTLVYMKMRIVQVAQKYKIKCFYILLIALAFSCKTDSEESPPLEPLSCDTSDPEINTNLIRESVEVLAADSLYGRWIKYNGIVKAQNYLVNRLRSLNLEPLDGSFLSPFQIPKSVPSTFTVSLNGNSISSDKLALLPLSELGSFTQAQLSQIKYFQAGVSFRKQYNEFLRDLYQSSASNRNILVIVPEAHNSEFNLLRKELANQMIFRGNVYFGGGLNGWDIWYGGNNVLFVLSNNIPVQTFSASYTIDKITLNNIAGVLPGKSKPQEIVIFSAHYDHLGIVHYASTDTIANGANDNASGVAGVLALADYYSRTREHERTLWFVFFNAEEQGLIGSSEFVSRYSGKKPFIKGVINLDMIGNPIAENSGVAYLAGFSKSTMGKEMQNSINCEARNILADSETNSLYSRSDNWSFNKASILAHTVITFNQENYPYYHGEDDEIDKVDLNVIQKVVKSVIFGSRTYVHGKTP
jgi:Peptidase family M28